MKITVNAENTIRNFGVVMSDKTKVLSELLQNARRAGATLVEFYATESDGVVELSVLDNGKGIDDFSKLFTLSESGWSQELASHESSFGLGFFSVLFAAQEVLVQSKNQSLLIDCAVARQMSDFGEPNVDHSCSDFTKITLRGVKLCLVEIRNKLEELAKYSRVPVAFNGAMLERPYSFYELQESAKEVVETPFGHLVVLNPWSDDIKIIVQDLLVGSVRGGDYLLRNNYLFSDTLQCRMPDRDVLINASEVEKSIRDWLHGFYKSKLENIKANMESRDFLNQYFKAVLQYHPAMLLDIDYLPAEAFRTISYPTQRSDYETDSFTHTSGVVKGESYVAFDDEPELYESPVAANFAFLAKARIPVLGLPENHWFFDSCIKNISDSEFEIECGDATIFDFELDYYGSGDALFAKEARVKHIATGHEVALSGDAFGVDIESYYSRDKSGVKVVVNGAEITAPTLIMQSAGDFIWGSDLLLQLLSYTSDCDEWRDTELESDVEGLERQFVAATKGNVEEILSQLLGKLPPVLAEKLNGKSLVMKIENGVATFTEKAA